jgi:uncharacterized protein (TIGR03435 family)
LKLQIMTKHFSTICLSIALAGAAFAQAPAAAPAETKHWEFEVASIKPAAPITPEKVANGQLHVGMTVDKARVDIGFLSLAELIPMAYRVKSYQVSGPSWMPQQRFDIVGKMPEGATREQVPDMLQALLTDRFKLTFHRETKEHSMYALVVSKKGLKLKEAQPEPVPAKTETADNGAPPDGATPVKNEDRPMSIKSDAKGTVISGGGQKGQVRISRGSEGGMRIESSKMTMEALAEALSRFVARPVVDMTDLKGDYEVALEISMADIMAMARAAGQVIPGGPGGGEPGKAPLDTASDPSGNSIFDAVQKLGLKLEARKGPIEVIIIDHVEKAPTEN